MNSKQVLRVLNNFKSVLPRDERGALNMGACAVNLCGTTHCHGGWYAVAAIPQRIKYLPFTLSIEGLRKIDFSTGAHKMAKHLGFKNSLELMIWAEENPEIWGNENGKQMFANSAAFFHPYKRPYGAGTISHIVDHWTEVYDRLVLLENPIPTYIEPAREDITKQLAQSLIVDEKLDVKTEVYEESSI